MSKVFKMSDSVLHRFVQILQEAILTGTDVADHLRMVEMQEDEASSGQLVLTSEYKELVAKQHESMLQFANEKRQELLTEAEKTEN